MGTKLGHEYRGFIICPGTKREGWFIKKIDAEGQEKYFGNNEGFSTDVDAESYVDEFLVSDSLDDSFDEAFDWSVFGKWALVSGRKNLREGLIPIKDGVEYFRDNFGDQMYYGWEGEPFALDQLAYEVKDEEEYAVLALKDGSTVTVEWGRGELIITPEKPCKNPDYWRSEIDKIAASFQEGLHEGLTPIKDGVKYFRDNLGDLLDYDWKGEPFALDQLAYEVEDGEEYVVLALKDGSTVTIDWGRDLTITPEKPCENPDYWRSEINKIIASRKEKSKAQHEKNWAEYERQKEQRQAQELALRQVQEKDYHAKDGVLLDVNDSLVEATVPDWVTAIGDGAFQKAKNLKSVIIPWSVTTIGKRAFANLQKLVDVKLGSTYAQTGITTIEEGAFEGCQSLTEISLPWSLERIGSRAFANTGLSKSWNGIFVPRFVVEIAEDAFAGNFDLTFYYDSPKVGALLQEMASRYQGRENYHWRIVER